MQLSSIETFSRLIQLCLLPVVLISAVGLLLLSITNRLGRTIDRSRLLARELNGTSQQESDTEDQVKILLTRSEVLRASVCLAAASILFGALMILGTFLLLLIKWQVQAALYLFFGASVVCLIGSVFFFLIDIFLSLRALKLEIATRL